MAGISKCLCEECQYNSNHECQAESIEVRSSGDMSVQSTDGTCCNTFTPRLG
ncbi:DUF1540 domain-containing protein [Desulforamulus reducens]|uniref:DUF1540 domain-containing protein n=1 Tax=Desulforamulus reducens TaxID=59610 RepID=UPI0002DBDA38|nr:DUF1540 domain-containing protein [Desulforamulus reducens]